MSGLPILITVECTRNHCVATVVIHAARRPLLSHVSPKDDSSKRRAVHVTLLEHTSECA
jgi:hypothetical protein